MRLFIAASFPEAVLHPLNDRLASLKSKLPPASWVRPESQHLTFAFLGEQEEAVVERLARQVEQGLEPARSFEATLHGCGFFPNKRHARVGWSGVEPQEQFCAVARSVREAVRAAGLVFEENEFRPHLTLMRMRDHWPPLATETFEKALRDYRSAPFTVDRITIYSSRLNPQGAIHTPVREFSFP